jgi:hypothetical protein
MAGDDGLDPLIAKVDRVASVSDAELRPLGLELEDVLREDNRKGVLEGTDKDGVPLPPVTYRSGAGERTRARTAAKGYGTLDRAAWRASNRAIDIKAVVRANNNLTTAEYQKLDGPPLAPRREGSRVITHFRTASGPDGPGRLVILGAWNRVLSIKGVPFLNAHFEGANTGRGKRTKLPKRDLRGVRPWGRRQAREKVRQWVRWLLGAGSP